MEALFYWLSFLGKEGALFVISMLPIIELRGAIILGAALEMPWQEVFFISLIGNLVPIPFIILFIKKLLYILKKFPLFTGFIRWYEGRLLHHSKKFERISFWALVFFVGIPLPGTGAWTGGGVAALLNMRLRDAFPAIALGVLIAAILMTGGAYGFFGLLDIFI